MKQSFFHYWPDAGDPVQPKDSNSSDSIVDDTTGTEETNVDSVDLNSINDEAPAATDTNESGSVTDNTSSGSTMDDTGSTTDQDSSSLKVDESGGVTDNTSSGSTMDDTGSATDLDSSALKVDESGSVIDNTSSGSTMDDTGSTTDQGTTVDDSNAVTENINSATTFETPDNEDSKNPAANNAGASSAASLGVDTATILTQATAANLSKETISVNGISKKPQFVLRYLRDLKKAEVDSIAKSGLKIGSISEYGLEIAGLGKDHASKAFAIAKSIGQPSDAPVYFAIDFDVIAYKMPDVIAYFSDINNYFKAQSEPFPVGVYGACNVLDELKAKGLCTYFWQLGSTAYAGGKNKTPWPDANIRQVIFEKVVGGVNVDINISDNGNEGSWG